MTGERTDGCLDLCLIEDAELGPQKCYMPIKVMTGLQAMLGSFVMITCGSRSFICSVWCKTNQDERLIKINKCVQTSFNSDSTDINIASGQDKQKIIKTDTLHKIKLLKPEKAKAVTVKVIIDTIENVIRLRKHSTDIHATVKECLLRFCVARGYIVNCESLRYAVLNGISSVVVLDLRPESGSPDVGDCIIDKGTEVIVDSVQSKECFKQLNHKSNGLKIGGLTSVVNMLEDLIKLPLEHKKQFQNLGIEPPRGILLQGPPGCGKTSVVRYVAKTFKTFLISVNGPEIFGSLPGETESNLRKVFEKAKLVSEEMPCILFIDEVDSLCPRKVGSSGVQESRVTGQLLMLLDGLNADSGVVVIAATNRPGALDPAVRRPGRLDREVLISVPTQKRRKDILLSHLSELPVASDLDIDYLSDVTNGYVGADLAALCHEAAYIAMNEMGPRSQAEESKVKQDHFVSALKKICPSLHRGTEAIVDVRPVHWQDIGGLEDVKTQIKQAVEWPLKHADAFERMGLPCPRGVLLYGPPGCCKTTLVRAAATSCHTTFLSVSAAQVFSPFVGDAERFLSEVFQKARATAPSILFIDEIDSLVGKRSESGQRGVQERVLSTLLNEMDGIGVRLDDNVGTTGSQKLLEGGTSKEEDGGVFKKKEENKTVLVVAATNRPDLLDEALVRPGRIDKVLYVPHPDIKAREEIINLYTKNMELSGVCIEDLAKQTDWYTGADLESCCREAALAALTEDIWATTVTQEHFVKALNSVKPSLNENLVEQYSNTHMSIFKHTRRK